MTGPTRPLGRRRRPDPRLPSLDPAHRALVRLCVAAADELPDELEAATALVGSEPLGPDGVDRAGQDLLGMVFRRIADADLDHPWREQLAPAYRRTWHCNQVLVLRARPVLERITELGGRPVVLKGSAMVSSAHYDDLGVRPFIDVDVLLERQWIEPVVEWALEHDWRVAKGLAVRDVLTVNHAIGLQYGDTGAVDLHWALLVQGRDPEGDRALHDRAVDATLDGMPVRVLQPTDQLFHTAAHAMPDGLRHVVDAISVIERHRSTVDWDALVDAVVRRRSLSYATATLGLVEAAKPGTVPADVGDALARAPRHWSDYPYHGQPMDSRREVVRRFAADIVARGRGTGPRESARIAVAMVRRYRSRTGASLRDLSAGFLRRGGEP